MPLEGFRRIATEVVFVEMPPLSDGTYRPVVGATVLALANVEVDLQRHRLITKRYYKLKRCAA